MAAPASAVAASAAAASPDTGRLPITRAPSNRYSLQLWTAPPARSTKQPVLLASAPLELRATSNPYAYMQIDPFAGSLKQWLDEHDQQADVPLPIIATEQLLGTQLSHNALTEQQCTRLLPDPQARCMLLPAREWVTTNRYGEVHVDGPVVLRLVDASNERTVCEWRFAYADPRVDQSGCWWSLTSDDQTVVLLASGRTGRNKTKMPASLLVNAVLLLEPAWHTPELTAIRVQLASDGVARALASIDATRQVLRERTRKAREDLDAAEAHYERCAKRLKIDAAPAPAAAASE